MKHSRSFDKLSGCFYICFFYYSVSIHSAYRSECNRFAKTKCNTTWRSFASAHNEINARFKFGGSCFPKDTKGLVSAAEKYKINLSVVKSVIKSNQERVSLLTQRIHKILGSNIKNKKISFLGVTFKPNTDDMRDSTSLKMIPYLCKKGAKVNYYDPSGEKDEFRKIKNCNYRNNIKSNCNGTDLVVLLTEWDEFKSIDFKKIVKNSKFKVYDLRNLYSAEEMKKNKIKYYSVGRPNTN